MTQSKQIFQSDKKTYYIYHIPGQKIGMTCNLNKRVELEQGYKKNEYDVLFSSRDINKTSWMERQLQKFYGYKVDRQLYSNLIKIKSMKVNPTEQTSTFNCDRKDLEKVLDQNDGLKWQTSLGTFEINNETKKWILANIKPSMYNNDRCFIYNKAYYEAFLAIGDSVVVLTNLSKLVGYDIESCIQSAYDEIFNRTGRMVDGTFVKDTL